MGDAPKTLLSWAARSYNPYLMMPVSVKKSFTTARSRSMSSSCRAVSWRSDGGEGHPPRVLEP